MYLQNIKYVNLSKVIFSFFPAADFKMFLSYQSFEVMCVTFDSEGRWLRPLPDPSLPKNPHRRKINGFSEGGGYMKVHECKKGTVYNEFGYCKHRLQPANCLLGKEKHF